MPDNFTPLLPSSDWNQEWKVLQKARRRKDNASYWDVRSHTFGSKDSPNHYVDAFLEKSGICAGESVLDMGCGTGALSLPLGMKNHPVIAADFSAGMLDKLRERLAEKSISSVSPLLMSWEDNWDDWGLGKNSVDLAFASRSVATDDLKSSLLKLTKVARKRACVTVTTGASPRVDERIMKALEIPCDFGHDYQYVLNILINDGLKPELSYIESTRKYTFDSIEEALDAFERMVSETAYTDEMNREELRKRLYPWIKDHLIKNSEAGKNDSKDHPQKAFCLDKPRSNVWAFISWNTDID